MLTTYEAIYHQGTLRGRNPPPFANEPLQPAAAEGEENDPTLTAFLSWLDQEMTKHPEYLEPIEEQELQEIAALIEGVELD